MSDSWPTTIGEAVVVETRPRILEILGEPAMHTVDGEPLWTRSDSGLVELVKIRHGACGEVIGEVVGNDQGRLASLIGLARERPAETKAAAANLGAELVRDFDQKEPAKHIDRYEQAYLHPIDDSGLATLPGWCPECAIDVEVPVAKLRRGADMAASGDAATVRA